jgi:hypothetical protein
MSSLPLFVEYGARATAPPPFLSTEGLFHGYLLEGDAELIANLCDRVLNAPAAGRVVYKPMFGKWVLLLTGAFAEVRSQAQGFEQWGSVDEAQTSLWVPVAAGRLDDGGEFVAERVCMAVPFILVNNPMSYAGGREDYGYPKSLGRFDPAAGVGEQLRVEAFGGNFAPAEHAGWHVLLELSRGKPAAPAEGARAGARGAPTASASPAPPQEMAEAFAQLASSPADSRWRAPELSVVRSVLEALTGRETVQVFLKQFRDVHTAGAACYQAIVEAPIQFLSTRVRPSLHRWQLVVNALDSHPIERELGVGTQTTRLSFELHMDFVAAAGKVVAP